MENKNEISIAKRFDLAKADLYLTLALIKAKEILEKPPENFEEIIRDEVEKRVRGS